MKAMDLQAPLLAERILHILSLALSAAIFLVLRKLFVCVSVQSMTWEGPCSVSLGLRPGLSVHGDHVLVFAEGLAKAEALDSTAGRTSRIQESCELSAWEAAPGGGLRNRGQVSADTASVHPTRKGHGQQQRRGRLEVLAGEQVTPPMPSAGTYRETDSH